MTFTVVELVCILIVIAGLTVAITKAATSKKVKKVGDLIVEFGEKVITITKNVIETEEIDPGSFDTEDAYREALAEKAADCLICDLQESDIYNSTLMSESVLSTVIGGVFKFYDKQLKITEIYNAAQEAKKNSKDSTLGEAKDTPAPEVILPTMSEVAAKAAMNITAEDKAADIPVDIKSEFTDSKNLNSVADLKKDVAANTDVKVTEAKDAVTEDTDKAK